MCIWFIFVRPTKEAWQVQVCIKICFPFLSRHIFISPYFYLALFLSRLIFISPHFYLALFLSRLIFILPYFYLALFLSRLIFISPYFYLALFLSRLIFISPYFYLALFLSRLIFTSPYLYLALFLSRLIFTLFSPYGFPLFSIMSRWLTEGGEYPGEGEYLGRLGGRGERRGGGGLYRKFIHKYEVAVV